MSAYPSIQSCIILNRTRNARLDDLHSRLRETFSHAEVSAGLLDGADPSLREAIEKADIIITATSSTAPLFPSEYVRPGTHLCLIGSYKPEM